jgi:ABC-2 type transport system permease protein
VFAGILMAFALGHLAHRPTFGQAALYAVFIGCGVTMLYSLMVVLGSISVWLVRNESLYDFWFYITNFSRYPMEIYEGPIGTPLRQVFTFLIPILVVVNVPARLMAKPLVEQDWKLAAFGIAATIVSFVVSRRLFHGALLSYRSASS